MSQLSEWFRDVLDAVLGDPQPWYRRKDLWMLVAAVLVPFGWVMPLYRFARVRAEVRRARRF